MSNLRDIAHVEEVELNPSTAEQGEAIDAQASGNDSLPSLPSSFGSVSSCAFAPPPVPQQLSAPLLFPNASTPALFTGDASTSEHRTQSTSNLNIYATLAIATAKSLVELQHASTAAGASLRPRTTEPISSHERDTGGQSPQFRSSDGQSTVRSSDAGLSSNPRIDTTSQSEQTK